MQTDPGFVFKYFDLLDGFIRVRQVEEGAGLPLPPGQPIPPDRRHYRRLLVRHCLENPEAILQRVHARYPEETETVEDLLYRICVDVNPHLEIHSVTIPAPAPEGEQTTQKAPRTLAQRARGIQSRLRRQVFGQDDAIESVSKAIARAAAGLNDPDRPLGCFLFVGRTGCGKTELAKALARELHPSRPLLRIDCTEYGHAHETARLTGAPPGYVGHNDGGLLTEPLLEHPDTVVLFDEIEKGHERLHHLLLQILDEGRLTDGKGRTIDLRKTMILLTSNIGTEEYRRAADGLGFGRTELDEQDFEQITHESLLKGFRPEFLNRLDKVLTFRPLDARSCQHIVRYRLESLRARVEPNGVLLRWTPAAVRRLAELGTHDEYGAREIRRTIDREVEEPLSHAILDRQGGAPHFLVRSLRGRIRVEREAA